MSQWSSDIINILQGILSQEYSEQTPDSSPMTMRYGFFIMMENQCEKLGKIFTGPIDKLLLSFMLISDDVYRLFIPSKTTLTK